MLALNAGSSSLKFGLYGVDGDKPQPIVAGEASAIGLSRMIGHVESKHFMILVGRAPVPAPQRRVPGGHGGPPH